MLNPMEFYHNKIFYDGSERRSFCIRTMENISEDVPIPRRKLVSTTVCVDSNQGGDVTYEKIPFWDLNVRAAERSCFMIQQERSFILLK